MGDRTIDFDQFRAEQQAEPVELIIGGERYQLAAGIPASVALEAARVQHVVKDIAAREDLTSEEKRKLTEQELGGQADELIVKTGESLFGAELFATLMSKHRITLEELPQLIAQTFAVYNQHNEGRAEPKPGSPETGIEGRPFSVIELWTFVESDFRREYGIDLTDEVTRMTWRQFQTYLRGMSPGSATLAAFRSEQANPREEVIVLETEEQVMAARRALFGSPPAARA